MSVAGPGLGPSHLGLESEVIAISTWPLAGDTCETTKRASRRMSFSKPNVSYFSINPVKHLSDCC